MRTLLPHATFLGLQAWIQRVPPQSVLRCRGSWSKRQALGAEPSLNHHSGGQPVRAAGHWRDHVGQSDHRDGLCRPCRPSTTRRGQAPCTANHQPRELAQTGEFATSRPLLGGQPVRARIPIKHRPNLDPCRSSASWTLGPPPGYWRAQAPCACQCLGGIA